MVWHLSCNEIRVLYTLSTVRVACMTGFFASALWFFCQRGSDFAHILFDPSVDYGSEEFIVYLERPFVAGASCVEDIQSIYNLNNSWKIRHHMA